MSDVMTRRQIASSATAIGAALCLILALGGALAAPVAAQESAARQILVEEFRLLPLRDALVFQPRDSELGITAIELTGDDLLVDGVSISLDELEARLGASAEPFRRLLALAEEDRRAWIEAPVVEVAPEAEPGLEPEGEVEPEADREEPEASADRERRSDQERREEVRRRIERARGRADTRVVVANALRVEEGEVSRDVVVFGGPLTVEGRVIGDASAIGGSARVSGEINGDLSVVGGSITLEDGAEVRGDVVSVGGEVIQEDGAVVDGQVYEVPIGPAVRIGDWDWDWDTGGRGWHIERPRFSFSPFEYLFDLGGCIFIFAFLAMLACVVLLVAPGSVELVSERASREPLVSGLAGCLSQILLLTVGVLVLLILVISVIGIPLVPIALFGLMLLVLLGYTAAAMGIGRWLERRFGWRITSPYTAVLVGVLAIVSLSFIGELLDFGGPVWFFSAIFALAGFVVFYLAGTVGFGATVLTRFGTAPGWGEERDWSVPSEEPSYAEPLEGFDYETPAEPELPGWEEPEPPTTDPVELPEPPEAPEPGEPDKD